MLGRFVSACLVSSLVAGFVVAGADPAPATVSTHGRAEAPPPGYKRLTNERVGYTLLYPAGWKVAGYVVATEFAATAGCQSVRKVEFAPPPDSGGGGAGVLQSLVQVCWKPVDGTTLDGFMQRTYGARLPSLFERTRLASVPAYRSGAGANATTFLQSDAFRLQLVTSTNVVADKATEALRSAQVRRIRASFALTRPR